MSTAKIALSVGASLLLVATFLAVWALRGNRETSEAALSRHATAPLGTAEWDLDERLQRLESLLTTQASRPPSELYSPPESEAALDISKTAADAPPLDSFQEQLEDFERRLRSLERDPLLRGFSYIESSDAKLRRRGIRALEEIANHNPEARDAIRQMLSDADSKVREEAIDALRDIQDREAVPLVHDLLGDPEADVRREAIQALVALGDESDGARIAELLNDSDDKVREEAAVALGRMKSRQGTDLLIAALDDADADVRKNAIRTLGKTGAKSALPALKDLYELDERKKSFRLARAIRDLGDTGPFEAEVDRLSATALDDPDEVVRYKALRNLADHARTEAQEIFLQALEDESSRVRKEAKKALRAEK